jgi:CheY-like chemotaxis protein/anti-sigma regulatory factor (Ser/Thr protein kinase)
MDEARILIADDTPFDRELLTQYLTAVGCEVAEVTDGVAALQFLEREFDSIDLLLLDRNMPRMGGLEVLQRMKEHPEWRALPVILQTALAGREEMLEGMEAGAYYYLTKPYDSKMLITVVATAVREYTMYRELQRMVRRGSNTLGLMRKASFSVRTVEEARDLGSVMASACPDPMNAVIGLTELLVNAVEHGNLGITYDEKTTLNASGQWDAEVRRRLALPENARKTVEVFFERLDGELRFTIRDEGCGFDWTRFVNVDPRRAFDNHGRGIVIARNITFDAVEYRGCGNEVVGTVRTNVVAAPAAS